jgi:hypothetical protein
MVLRPFAHRFGKVCSGLRNEKAFAAKVTGSEKVFAAERRLEFSPAF